MDNERILKELMGATSEAEIRAWIIADMEKFNSDLATNYQNYNTIFQDNLLTPYKEANEELARLRRERLELLDASSVLGSNDSMASSSSKYTPDMKNYGDLDDSIDYAAKMINSKTQEEFDYWAGYRDEKMKRNDQLGNGSDFGIDGSGKTFRYKSNEEIKKEWEEKGNKATGGEYWGNGYSDGIEGGPVTYTGLAMLHGSSSKPEYVLNSDQAYTLLHNMATTKLPAMERTVVDNSSAGTQYIVQGDVVLEGVNDPAKFWSGVTSAMSSRWNVTKKNRG